MSYDESVIAIPSGDAQLFGILSLPADALRRPPLSAMVIIVGGPQYRVGSHRQFTLLARRLACEGQAVLRFDYAGMGDSGGAKREFTATGTDIRAALDALHARLPSLQATTLWGLCDGASAALLYLDEYRDPRVKGLCLVNPWVRSDESLARVQIKHYYIARLMQADFWKKLLSGKVALAALSELGGKLITSLSNNGPARESLSYQQRMLRAWTAFPGHILLLLSELDLVAKEFVDHTKSRPEWQTAMRQGSRLQIQHLPDADHTCSNAKARGLVENCTLAWQRALVA